jgi:hypothetical protein
MARHKASSSASSGGTGSDPRRSDDEPAGEEVLGVAKTDGAGSDVELASVMTCGSSVEAFTPRE